MAEYTILLQDFSFGQARPGLSERNVEVERVKSTGDSIRVYLWVSATTTPNLKPPEQSNFESLTHLDTVGDECLFRTDLPATQASVLKGMDNADVILESATLKS